MIGISGEFLVKEFDNTMRLGNDKHARRSGRLPHEIGRHAELRKPP